jgi:hypothetical protein
MAQEIEGIPKSWQRREFFIKIIKDPGYGKQLYFSFDQPWSK